MSASSSVYPLGLRIEGRAVVVVGAGRVAARRAAALVEAGALVTLVAPELGTEAQALVTTGAVGWRSRGYVTGDLDGAWLVHTATGVGDVDALVAADAEAARIWCVRADDHLASAAWTPAVAREDGLAVGVHAGGDPRRAMALRDAIAERLATGDLAAPRSRPERTDARPAARRQPAGTVALVGAGPGGAGLLTSRGRDLLLDATVVLADRLGARSVLDEIATDALVIPVGKLPGNHPVPQSEINRMLVDLAREGHRVVRLKGGDPYVLGRGGEELEHCRAHGIDVEVVSGVTSAIAVPAAAGIPVTHRGVAAGFTVVSGHEGLADVPGGRDHTVVLLMGVAGLASSAADLAAGGRGDDCPVAIIEDGYGPGERVTITTLRDAARDAAEREVRSPAIVVVGDVVLLSPYANDAGLAGASDSLATSRKAPTS